jgi:hypothetical protein
MDSKSLPNSFKPSKKELVSSADQSSLLIFEDLKTGASFESTMNYKS